MELKARSEHSSTRPDIRRAEFTEASAIAALIESCYRGESAAQGWTSEANLVSGDRTSREEIESIIASPRSLLLVGVESEQIIGCVKLEQRNSQEVFLGMLCVHPTRQQQRFGSMLIARAEEAAHEHFDAEKIELWVLSGRDELIAWYERRGFSATGAMIDFGEEVDPSLALVNDLAFIVFQKSIARER